MPNKALVLDANILIRAVLGQRVRRILETHAGGFAFFIPQTAYAEAEEHLAALVVKRGGSPAQALRLLQSLAALGTVVSHDLYADFEEEARMRLGSRDPDDWPILTAAFALDCPIWTEDAAFLAAAWLRGHRLAWKDSSTFGGFDCCSNDVGAEASAKDYVGDCLHSV